jgi:glycosyltransferase involved in cell wall biosynthesis
MQWDDTLEAAFYDDLRSTLDCGFLTKMPIFFGCSGTMGTVAAEFPSRDPSRGDGIGTGHQTMKTTLVIPNYNDAERLGPFLKDLCREMSAHFEILVSDDRSRESERSALRDIVRQAQSRGRDGGPTVRDALFTERNTGKGGAILRGWDAAADSELLAFADADGAVGAGEILRAESFFRSTTYDALFANRVKMLGRTVDRTLKRHLSGRVFATLVSVVGRVPAYDTQCGLKISKPSCF